MTHWFGRSAWLVLGTGLGAGACASAPAAGSSGSAAAATMPVSQNQTACEVRAGPPFIAEATPIAALRGDFRIVLTESRGAGRTDVGTLHLRDPLGDPAGQLAAPLDSIGARVFAPGPDDKWPVQVVEWFSEKKDRSVVIRLTPPVMGPPRGATIEGPHFAMLLYVFQADSFAGRWNSERGDSVASGTFCARRIP